MQTIRARISGDHDEMRDVHGVSVFGHSIGKEFSEIEVTDEVLAKLKGNPAIEVQVKKAAAPAPAPAPEAKPPASA